MDVLASKKHTYNKNKKHISSEIFSGRDEKDMEDTTSKTMMGVFNFGSPEIRDDERMHLRLIQGILDKGVGVNAENDLRRGPSPCGS